MSEQPRVWGGSAPQYDRFEETQMNNGIFRQKNIDKVSSPEKLDDYIRVTTPSVWITLAAIVLLLIGALVWGTFGELTVHNADGTTKTVAPISYILN